MYILGIDLSGPVNVRATCAARFRVLPAALEFVDSISPANDDQLLDLASRSSDEGEVAIGLDAPLGYGARGGDRFGDSDLRRRIVEIGMRSGSVIAPTAPRMVYLTLRGIRLSMCLERLPQRHRIRIVEVHPGATMGLRGAPIQMVRTFSESEEARQGLLEWLGKQGLTALRQEAATSEHFVAACAAALAAWKWTREESVWRWRAQPPMYLYDFAC